MRGLELEWNGRPSVVCIAGPTASGKTGLAVRVAKAVGGEVVNADALQVYRDLSVLSARPIEAEMDGVPHHLFGYVPGGTIHSTGAWLRDVAPVIDAIGARGKVPVVAGGTGLYFKALLEGLADIPAIPDEVMGKLERLGPEHLREEAERVDPIAAARILGDDPQRLQRLIGVHRHTGRALSDWQAETHPVLPQRATVRAVLLPDRAELYARIDRRFDRMIENGALEEARAVRAQRYPARAPMLKAIGLSHLLSHLDGECDLDTAVETAKRDSRRLAKRQMTWFRNRCADWTVLRTEREMDLFVNGLDLAA
ncbi:MAG: tRNA (adenosine(37)-N6)-dimethylallyltransferase MiaA [Litorimonas sp.]